MSPCRFAWILGVLGFVAASAADELAFGAAPARDAELSASSAELDAELAALSELTSEQRLTLSSSFGYRDNILLSAFAPINCGFVQGEIEGLVWRLPADQWEALAFLNGDVLRYFSPPPETRGEQQWFGHGEVRWLPGTRGSVSFTGDVYYQDAVMDLSETQAIRLVMPTRTSGLLVTLGGRADLFQGFSFIPAIQAHRSTYRDIPGDYDELKGGARLEWKRFSRLAVSAGWYERARSYAERTEFTAGGRPLPGTQLHFQQTEVDLKVGTSWRAAGSWTAVAAASVLENEDGASGYFDYREKRARLDLTWARAEWRVTLGGLAKRRDYLVQTAGIGIAPPPRVADDHEVSGRVEREWTKTWTTFVEYSWERSRSNDASFNYESNMSAIGVEWTL